MRRHLKILDNGQGTWEPLWRARTKNQLSQDLELLSDSGCSLQDRVEGANSLSTLLYLVALNVGERLIFQIELTRCRNPRFCERERPCAVLSLTKDVPCAQIKGRRQRSYVFALLSFFKSLQLLGPLLITRSVLRTGDLRVQRVCAPKHLKLSVNASHSLYPFTAIDRPVSGD